MWLRRNWGSESWQTLIITLYSLIIHRSLFGFVHLFLLLWRVYNISTIYQHDCDGIFRLYFYSVWTSLCFVCFHNCKGSSSNHSAYCKVLYYPVCFYVVFIWMVAIMCKIISNRHIQRFLLKNILTLINIFCHIYWLKTFLFSVDFFGCYRFWYPQYCGML